jgi:hypothetical protein
MTMYLSPCLQKGYQRKKGKRLISSLIALPIAARQTISPACHGLSAWSHWGIPFPRTSRPPGEGPTPSKPSIPLLQNSFASHDAAFSAHTSATLTRRCRMCCERCDGLMVLDHLVDLQSSQPWLSAWRCANCGNVVDDQIRRHRFQPPTLCRGRHAAHPASLSQAVES